MFLEHCAQISLLTMRRMLLSTWRIGEHMEHMTYRNSPTPINPAAFVIQPSEPCLPSQRDSADGLWAVYRAAWRGEETDFMELLLRAERCLRLHPNDVLLRTLVSAIKRDIE
jgi:hypothetical protein